MAGILPLIHSTPGLIFSTLLAIAIGIYVGYQYLRLCITRTHCVSVNYHFTRKCNKTCKFCFHTEKSSHVASKEEMMRGLQLLKKAGMRKINFAGGEPFLYPERLGWLCRYCKEVLGLESVSIITNGTKVTKTWLDDYGTFVDFLGVSCDSLTRRPTFSSDAELERTLNSSSASATGAGNLESNSSSIPSCAS
jgi:sulfatase maturation enzyme AslB (radical SAM superfamily)